MPSQALDVVVTGAGVVCATGGDVDQFRQSLVEGRSGLRPTTVGSHPEVWAGTVDRLIEPRPVWPGLDLTRDEALAIRAAREATGSARLAGVPVASVGVYVGTCQGSLPMASAPPGELASFDRYSTVTLAETVARALGFDGPAAVTSNACSASASAIAAAAEALVAGRIAAAVVGGADSLELFTVHGFAALASLDAQGCSPYHRSGGLVVGEGAGFLVLETFADAARRRAPVRGRLLGWGASADAYHPTAPDPSGRGAALAVERALGMAGCLRQDVDYISGHGTGTPANDSMELRAFSLLFGGRTPPLSSTKSMIGHTLGAASAIESIATLLGMESGFLPPTLSGGAAPLRPTGAVCPADVVSDHARSAHVRRSVKTSYAFGGSNYALVWAAASEAPPAANRSKHRREEPVVTGVGLLGPAGTTFPEWRSALAAGRSALRRVVFDQGATEECWALVGRCPPVGARGPASPKLWRRMDALSRRCLLAAHSAIIDAGLRLSATVRDDLVIVFATSTGPTGVLTAYRRNLHARDPNGSAALFPNTAPNAAAGHVAAALGVHGGIASFTSGALSSDIALRHATDLVRHVRCERVLFIAAEEISSDFVRARCRLGESSRHVLRERHDGLAPALALSEGVVCLLIEGSGAASERGAPPYATYLGAGENTDRSSGKRNQWASTMAAALDDAGVDGADVDIAFLAPSDCEVRESEYDALAAVAPSAYAASIAPTVGDPLGASGAVGAVAAMGAFTDPRTSTDPGAGAQLALVDSASPSGRSWASVWAGPRGMA